MTRVALIVTGRLEERALAASLAGVFPGVEFVTRPAVDGFTSSRVMVAAQSDGGASSSVAKFAAKVAAEAYPGRGRDRSQTLPDFVFALDDLELVNVDQPALVVSSVRNAVERHIGEFWQAEARERALEAVRRKCSFHLMAPMPETYFFGEPASLVRAGAVRPSRFDLIANDVEAFSVDDPEYSKPPDLPRSDPRWQRGDWRRPERARHPKLYLTFLTDARGDGAWDYDEDAGCNALRTLDWRQVLSDPARARFARSLFADLADALGQANPFPGACAPETSAVGGLLRNI